MHKFVITAAMFLVHFSVSAELTQSQIKEKMFTDLDVIQQTFEVMYAPKDWKKTYTDWELQDQIEKAKAKILEQDPITIKDYQYIVRDFFHSTKDYHVGVQFFSTEVTALPIRLISTQGRYFIAWAEQNQWYPLMDYSLDVGDEVLMYNYQPIDQVIQEFKLKEFGNPYSLTDQAMAETTFTLRSGINAHSTLQGNVVLTVRKANTNKIEDHQLFWGYQPEKITGNFVDTAKGHKEVLGENHLLGDHPFFKKDMTTPHFYMNQASAKLGRKALKNIATLDEDDEDDGMEFIGQKKSFLPPLGKITWQADPNGSFDAYIYTTPTRKRIGYLRIPHYQYGSDEAEEAAQIISSFQRRTDALVIDQLNNPGGSMFYMYSLASMLSNKPMVVPKHRMMITSSDIYFSIMVLEDDLMDITSDEEAIELIGDSLGGYPVTLALVQGLINHFNFIMNEWNDGRMFTQPTYLYGVDYLQPYPTAQYTKPILVLVNHLDFSCGDFFPAILQDNKRATIVGTQTAGAGGYVLGHEFLNLFGIDYFSFTGSIAERINSNPIENLGVTPDILLEITPDDLEYNYRDYIKGVNKAVESLF